MRNKLQHFFIYKQGSANVLLQSSHAVMNASESNSTASQLILSYPEKIFVATMELLISICGISSNSIIILAVCLSKKLQTRTNVFVVSLTAADLLSSVGLIPNIIALYGRSGWALPGHEWFCELGAFLLLTCLGVGLYSLSGIALNRMILITRPVMYRKIYSTAVLFLMTFAAWIIPVLVITIPTTAGVGGFGYDHADTTCTDLDQLPNAKAFNLIQTLFFFPGPLTIMVVCYARTFLFIKMHFNTQLQRADKSENRKTLVRMQEVEITKNLFLVAVAFILCFTPYWLTVAIPGGQHAVLYTGIILGFNVFINPIIYSLKHPHFKVVVKAMIQWKWRDIPEPSALLQRFY